jgi:hypothetical protein
VGLVGLPGAGWDAELLAGRARTGFDCVAPAAVASAPAAALLDLPATECDAELLAGRARTGFDCVAPAAVASSAPFPSEFFADSFAGSFADFFAGFVAGFFADFSDPDSSAAASREPGSGKSDFLSRVDSFVGDPSSESLSSKMD